QVVARGGQLLQQAADLLFLVVAVAACGTGGRRAARWPLAHRGGRRGILEQDPVAALARIGVPYGNHRQRDIGVPVVRTDTDALLAHDRVLAARALQERAQRNEQSLAGHLEDVEACLARGGCQVSARVAAELQD